MRLILKITLFLIALMGARISLASTAETAIGKSDVSRIKILNNGKERVSFYLTDQHKTKYRIAGLNQRDAAAILTGFKNQKKLLLSTQPNKRGYLDVTAWRHEP